MELRSGRRPSSPSPHGDRRRSLVDGDGVDRISALPDDLLLQVLGRLRCARDAARTGFLSRRWRGLWRRLPELHFREIAAEALSAGLGQVAQPPLSLLEIDMPEKHRIMDPARVSALLHAAARLAPANLVLSVWGHHKDHQVPIQIPCFDRPTSMKLTVYNLLLTPPAQGAEFPVLERLYMSGSHFDMNALVTRCPRLRVLEVFHCAIGKIKVHSPTIEELVVKQSGYTNCIDIMAPVLKRLTMDIRVWAFFDLCFSAPMVEDISWKCRSSYPNIGVGHWWRLHSLNLWTEKSARTLQLFIDAKGISNTNIVPPVERSIYKHIAPLPFFSVLELLLLNGEHVFGSAVLNLLEIRSTIRRLKVVIQHDVDEESCPPECPCDEPQNWRSQSVSLVALEQVEIKGFNGTDHEIDFLKLLFRCATLMKTMTVILSANVLGSDREWAEIYSIFKENPYVKCAVFTFEGKQVLR